MFFGSLVIHSIIHPFRLVEAGLLDLDRLDVEAFPLARINECVRGARQRSALQFAVLEPCK